jgi:hypothetical protein
VCFNPFRYRPPTAEGAGVMSASQPPRAVIVGSGRGQSQAGNREVKLFGKAIVGVRELCSLCWSRGVGLVSRFIL